MCMHHILFVCLFIRSFRCCCCVGFYLCYRRMNFNFAGFFYVTSRATIGRTIHTFSMAICHASICVCVQQRTYVLCIVLAWSCARLFFIGMIGDDSHRVNVCSQTTNIITATAATINARTEKICTQTTASAATTAIVISWTSDCGGNRPKIMKNPDIF